MADSKVCIVFAADFGDALRQLDLSIPIWIVRSPQNDPVIAELWNAKVGSVTSFRPEDFDQLVDTVDQHHPGWNVLDVHGLRHDKAEETLAEYGGGQFEPTSDGFTFRRTV
jgi:hypothetical protein